MEAALYARIAEMRSRIEEIGIVPVVKITKAEYAVPLARALQRGGVSVAEITFRTGAAGEAITQIHREVPEILLGAGTLRSAEQLDEARKAGAQFGVTPGLNEEVVEHALETGFPLFPGIQTPTEVERALSYGYDTLKFFPAEAAGGVETLKAYSGPYGEVSFIPTGGINADNMESFLQLKNVIAVGGSWLVKPVFMEDDKWDEIERLAAEARRIITRTR
jgi:2-dehydro-3-deoxyphosphogluconate aldolase/(4S)-4-hydroxy-2-oxoglutarate aldolase